MFSFVIHMGIFVWVLWNKNVILSQAWSWAPVVSAAQEAEVGGNHPIARVWGQPGQHTKTHLLKNKKEEREGRNREKEKM